MGRIGCLIIAIIVIAGIGIALGILLPKWLAPGVDLSSPIATVDSFLDAAEDQDAGRMADCCYFADPADRDFYIDSMQEFFDDVESMDISDIDKEVTAETEDTATVNATYHLIIHFTEESGIPDVDEDATDMFDLEKHNGDWLIVLY